MEIRQWVAAAEAGAAAMATMPPKLSSDDAPELMLRTGVRGRDE
jgi:hypothetical protein